MWWSRKQPELPKPDPGPSNAAVMEQIDIFRRQLKRFEGELDEALQRHQALSARMHKALDKVEKGAQQPAGSTIGTPAGVTPPPPGSDPWVALSQIRAQKRAG